MAMHILLVDDEAELTTPLGRILQQQGYTVEVAHTGAEGQRLAQSQAYDLLILDWMLPQVSGLDICRQVRAQGNTTPVLFLTAKDTIDDRVAGLDAGGDDYLVKPFELRELLARVRALLRRPPALEAPESRPLTYQDLRLDVENQLAYRQGQAIELSEKETQLLTYLLRHPNQVLSHQDIQGAVWGSEAPASSNVLAAQMRLLRRKVEPPGVVPLIHTVYGKGYRLGTG